MALVAPLLNSGRSSHFLCAPQSDMSVPSETETARSPALAVSSPPPPTDSASLRPNSAQRISSYSTHIMSPSDIVGPSPVTSNGTETTEIEDDMSDEVRRDISDGKSAPELRMLTTTLPDNVRQYNPEEAVSVIHAPESFSAWASSEASSSQDKPRDTSSQAHDGGVKFSADDIEAHGLSEQPPRPPILTDIKPVRYSLDNVTPRAQDLQDMLEDTTRLRSSSTSSLEKIDEQTEAEGDCGDSDASHAKAQVNDEDTLTVLRRGFQECWTLCNTLASLSSIHRARVFSSSGTPDANEKAWKTCWEMCQRLYDNQYADETLNIEQNLDLCREFCLALFAIRQKTDESADSVLRVSFELNNHLYTAQDHRNLPELYCERTLDFYNTLCHRLMKQRSDFADGTDQLLRACWTLADMLFRLRENRRDGKPQDEELLESAVQACWDLCDIFRDGWTQVRPERITPRPSQTTFFPQQSFEHSGNESRASNRSSRPSRRGSLKGSQEDRPRKPPPVPETPVTEFEDTPISPESRSPQMPNIMVLGPTGDNARGGRWSSNASNLSSYSQSSNRSSSTATTTATTEDPNITRCKVLVVRAAMTLGFSRDSITDPKSGSAVLQKFVQSLPTGSFGSLPSHTALLQQYKNSVLTDAIIPRSQTLPARGKRVSALDLAKSVETMSKSSQRYVYLRDLFKFVFQFPIEEVESRRNVSIIV